MDNLFKDKAKSLLMNLGFNPYNFISYQQQYSKSIVHLIKIVLKHKFFFISL